MKKILFTLFAFAIFGGNAWGQSSSPRVYIDPDPAEIKQGGEGVINICVDRAGEELRDLQLDITLPDGFEFVSERVSDNQIHVVNNENKKPDLQGNNQDTNGKIRRFIMFSFGGLLMNDGPVLEITIKNTSAFDLDSKHTAKAKNVILSANLNASQSSQSGAHQIDFDPFDINLKIIENVIWLDEDATSDDQVYAYQGAVRVKRTIKANQWNTIVLPFAMDEEQMEESFGDGVQLADLVSVKSNDEYSSINLEFSSVSPVQIAAHHPYIIKLPEDEATIDNFYVENVEMEPYTEEEDGKTVVVDPYKDLDDYNGNVFYGVYSTKQIKSSRKKIGSNTYLNSFYAYLSGNKFYYLVENATTTIKGFRGYFKLEYLYDYIKNLSSSTNVNFFVDDEQITGIDGISSPTQSVKGVYDLQGRKMNVHDNDQNNLPKGVYIIDGKKVVVK